MSRNLFHKRFDVVGDRITVSPQGRSLVTAACSSGTDGEGCLFDQGLVIFSGLRDDLEHTLIVRHFGPVIARQLECRMPAMTWHELQSDGILRSIRIEWGALMNTIERSVRNMRANISGLDWFITPQESVRRLVLTGGAVAQEMLDLHGLHAKATAQEVESTSV